MTVWLVSIVCTGHFTVTADTEQEAREEAESLVSYSPAGLAGVEIDHIQSGTLKIEEVPF